MSVVAVSCANSSGVFEDFARVRLESTGPSSALARLLLQVLGRELSCDQLAVDEDHEHDDLIAAEQQKQKKKKKGTSSSH